MAKAVQQKLMVNKFREAFARIVEQTQEEKDYDIAIQSQRQKANEDQREPEKDKRIISESPRSVTALRFRGKEKVSKFKCPQILVRKQGKLREAGSLQNTERNQILLSKLARQGGPLDQISKIGFSKRQVAVAKRKQRQNNDESFG